MSFGLGSLGRPRAWLAAALTRYRYGISALDQMALSVFGFALNLCLIRALSATDYGIVTLWMTMALLAIGIQDALVNTPLSTHLPATATEPERASALARGIAVVNLLVTALTTAAIVIVNHVVEAEWAPRDAIGAAAIAIFVASGMYREFYRSIAFSRNDMAMLLWIDAPYLSVTMLCLAAMLVWPAALANLATAFLAMSAGCVAGRLCLGGRGAIPDWNPLRRGWWPEYRRILRDAGWALIGVLTTHLQARSYVYIIVNLVGLAGLAAINVVLLLFRPVRIMATAWGRTALPELAADLAAGRIAAFDRAIARALAAACAGSAAWFFALWLGWDLIERHFLAGHYPDAWALMLPAAVVAMLDAMSYAVSIGLRAHREFKFLAYATMLTAPITIAATAAVIVWHGYTWTMYGVALGDLVMLAIEAGRLHRVRREALTAARDPRPSLPADG